MTLRSLISQTTQLLAEREAARLKWLELLKARSAEAGAAREAHIELDAQVDQNYTELVEMLSTSRGFGLTEFDLLGLDEQERKNLRHLLSERLQMGLLERPRPDTLPELVTLWRAAMLTRDAARELEALQGSSGPDEFPARVASFDGKIRKMHPRAWDRAVRGYEAVFAALTNGVQFTGSPLWNEQGRAARDCVRRFREHYERLAEQLQSMIEEVGDGLWVEMSELGTDERAALRAALEDGLDRRRRLAPQTQADPRTRVGTMTMEEVEATDAEAEAWTQPDEGVR